MYSIYICFKMETLLYIFKSNVAVFFCSETAELAYLISLVGHSITPTVTNTAID